VELTNATSRYLPTAITSQFNSHHVLFSLKCALFNSCFVLLAVTFSRPIIMQQWVNSQRWQPDYHHNTPNYFQPVQWESVSPMTQICDFNMLTKNYNPPIIKNNVTFTSGMLTKPHKQHITGSVQFGKIGLVTVNNHLGLVSSLKMYLWPQQIKYGL